VLDDALVHPVAPRLRVVRRQLLLGLTPGPRGSP
jgi:hypothetical protein